MEHTKLSPITNKAQKHDNTQQHLAQQLLGFSVLKSPGLKLGVKGVNAQLQHNNGIIG